jgi:hypothetical protein
MWEETRVSSRNLEGKMGTVLEQAATLTKKRNLKGDSNPPLPLTGLEFYPIMK